MSARSLYEWQRQFAEAPEIWAVVYKPFGEPSEDGNLYESREAAEYEMEFHRKQGERAASRYSIERRKVHTLELSRERWNRRTESATASESKS
jgi:hypothetical protein